MADIERLKLELKKLIDDFRANQGQYERELEANTETKLVEPLFRLLGWTEKDFEKQASARRGEKRGRPDYAFKINDRIIFFLEVKKAGISLDKEADKQVISYALSKRIPFAVSTNFEELKIFCVEQENAIKNVFRVFRQPEDYLSNLQDLLFLSKESCEKGFMLKKAEDEGRLRKKSSIDKALLEDLMHIRGLIASDIEKSYSGKYEINEKDEIIQRILDRLIFIRKCEDSSINPDNLSLEEIKQLPDNKAYPKLKEIFKTYNDIYNSGLFAINVDSDCDKITIDGAIIKRLIYYLYESRDGQYVYNFDWIDADVLGQVYEQYLGKVLAQTKSGKAKLKDGQAHRKEQGIYYTPTYIVEYIVNNTVGELLKDKKVDAGKIKILDPACGSGSFLIKAFDYLNKHLADSEEAKQHKIDSQGAYSIKTEMLKNNIYGVDLDNKAVEITKLNLLLKAAEKDRKLPEEVDMHIRHGNSLIDDESVDKWAFKWERDFREGSFDVVIGNPPYLQMQRMSPTEKKIIELLHSEVAESQNDLWYYFLYKSIKMLREGGLLGFIVSRYFLEAAHAKKLRQFILNNTCINQIIDFKWLNIFEGVGTHTTIVILKKQKSQDARLKNKIKVCSINDVNLFRSNNFRFYYVKQSNLSENIWELTTDEESTIISSLRKDSSRLGDICILGTGVKSGNDKSFIVDEKIIKEEKLEKIIIKPWIKNSQIKRYYIESPKKYVIYTTKKNKVDEISNNIKHLEIYKTTLLKKNKTRKEDLEWWQLYRPREYLFDEPKEKLICPYKAKSNTFTYDSSEMCGSGDIYAIIPKIDNINLKYLLGLLNSKVLSYYFSKVGKKKGKLYEYYSEPLKEIPIHLPKNNKELIIKDKIINLVDKMLSLNKELNKLGSKNTSETAKLKQEIERTDQEIDWFVYKIYGITREEQKVIEENLK